MVGDRKKAGNCQQNVVYISIFLSIRSLSNLAVLYFSLKKPASLLYHHVAWFVIQSVTAEKKKKQACTALSLSLARALSLFVSLCISMLPLGMRHWTAECSPLTSLQSRVHYVHYMPCNTSKGSASIAPSLQCLFHFFWVTKHNIKVCSLLQKDNKYQ